MSIAISGEARCTILDYQSVPFDVTVRQISKAGLKFITAALLKPDTEVRLDIQITNLEGPIVVTAKVLWQRKLKSRFLLDTGVKFTKINDENSSRMMKYIYEYSTDLSVISREYLRCSLITEVNFININAGNIKNNCLSADIGIKGMKLLASEMLDIGTEIIMSFELPEYKPYVFNIRAKIVWVKSGANIVLGVRFTNLSELDRNRIVRYVEDNLVQKS